jgi:hypothetical protein
MSTVDRPSTQADHCAESVAAAWIAAALLYGSPTTCSPPCCTKVKPLLKPPAS